MSPLKKILLTIALTAMWSPSYLFIKLAIEDFQPLTVAASRVTLGGLILFVIMTLRGNRLPKDLWFWIHSTMMAIFASVIPFTLFCLAEQSIESALAAIINGGAPMFTALLAHATIPSDRMNTQKALGISLSTIGLLFLFAPNIMGGLSGTTFGMLAAIGGTISYGISHVYAKKYIMGQAHFVAPTAQLISSAVILLPLMFLVDQPYNMSTPSLTSILGIAGLTCFGTVLALSIYYNLIEHCGATAVSMVACFFPVGGMLLGFIFLNEQMPPQNLAAAAVILLGMMLVNGLIKLRVVEKEKMELQD
ncbi:MAG: EamA family transporter [Parachlamydiaceae bacterium]|nr:EamA family transporter [Parachlamydiaceae bacterium]